MVSIDTENTRFTLSTGRTTKGRTRRIPPPPPTLHNSGSSALEDDVLMVPLQTPINYCNCHMNLKLWSLSIQESDYAVCTRLLQVTMRQYDSPSLSNGPYVLNILCLEYFNKNILCLIHVKHEKCRKTHTWVLDLKVCHPVMLIYSDVWISPIVSTFYGLLFQYDLSQRTLLRINYHVFFSSLFRIFCLFNCLMSFINDIVGS
jgi:hypothetical protein